MNKSSVNSRSSANGSPLAEAKKTASTSSRVSSSAKPSASPSTPKPNVPSSRMSSSTVSRPPTRTSTASVRKPAVPKASSIPDVENRRLSRTQATTASARTEPPPTADRRRGTSSVSVTPKPLQKRSTITPTRSTATKAATASNRVPRPSTAESARSSSSVDRPLSQDSKIIDPEPIQNDEDLDIPDHEHTEATKPRTSPPKLEIRSSQIEGAMPDANNIEFDVADQISISATRHNRTQSDHIPRPSKPVEERPDDQGPGLQANGAFLAFMKNSAARGKMMGELEELRRDINRLEARKEKLTAHEADNAKASDTIDEEGPSDSQLAAQHAAAIEKLEQTHHTEIESLRSAHREAIVALSAELDVHRHRSSKLDGVEVKIESVEKALQDSKVVALGNEQRLEQELREKMDDRDELARIVEDLKLELDRCQVKLDEDSKKQAEELRQLHDERALLGQKLDTEKTLVAEKSKQLRLVEAEAQQRIQTAFAEAEDLNTQLKHQLDSVNVRYDEAMKELQAMTSVVDQREAEAIAKRQTEVQELEAHLAQAKEHVTQLADECLSLREELEMGKKETSSLRTRLEQKFDEEEQTHSAEPPTAIETLEDQNNHKEPQIKDELQIHETPAKKDEETEHFPTAENTREASTNERPEKDSQPIESRATQASAVFSQEDSEAEQQHSRDPPPEPLESEAGPELNLGIGVRAQDRDARPQDALNLQNDEDDVGAGDSARAVDAGDQGASTEELDVRHQLAQFQAALAAEQKHRAKLSASATDVQLKLQQELEAADIRTKTINNLEDEIKRERQHSAQLADEFANHKNQAELMLADAQSEKAILNQRLEAELSKTIASPKTDQIERQMNSAGEAREHVRRLQKDLEDERKRSADWSDKLRLADSRSKQQIFDALKELRGSMEQEMDQLRVTAERADEDREALRNEIAQMKLEATDTSKDPETEGPPSVQQIEVLKEENARLTKELQAYTDGSAEDAQRIQSSVEKDLLEQLNELQLSRDAESQQHRTVVAELESTMSNMQETIQQHERNEEQAAHRIDELNANMEEANQEQAALRQKYEDIRAQMQADIVSIRQECIEHKNALEEEQTSKEALRLDLENINEDLKARIETLQADKGSGLQGVAKLEADLRAIETERDEVREQWKTELENLQLTHESELREQRERAEALSSKVTALESTRLVVENLQTEITQLQQELSDAIKVHGDQQDTMRSTISTLESSATDQATEHHRTTQDLISKMDNLKSELQQQRHSAEDDLQQRSVEISKSSQIIEVLQNEITTLRQSLHQEETARQGLDKELQTREEALVSIRTRYERSRERQQDTTRQHLSQQQAYDRLVNSLMETEEKKKALEISVVEARDESKSLRKVLDTFTQEAEETEKRHNNVLNRLQQEMGQISNTQLQNFRESHAIQLENLRDSLNAEHQAAMDSKQKKHDQLIHERSLLEKKIGELTMQHNRELEEEAQKYEANKREMETSFSQMRETQNRRQTSEMHKYVAECNDLRIHIGRLNEEHSAAMSAEKDAHTHEMQSLKVKHEEHLADVRSEVAIRTKAQRMEPDRAPSHASDNAPTVSSQPTMSATIQNDAEPSYGDLSHVFVNHVIDSAQAPSGSSKAQSTAETDIEDVATGTEDEIDASQLNRVSTVGVRYGFHPTSASPDQLQRNISELSFALNSARDEISSLRKVNAMLEVAAGISPNVHHDAEDPFAPREPSLFLDLDESGPRRLTLEGAMESIRVQTAQLLEINNDFLAEQQRWKSTLSPRPSHGSSAALTP